MGRQVKVTGNVAWKSKHGYLPGELFGFMNFFSFLLFMYATLFIWYAILMYYHRNSSIPIEKWIFMTITIGFFEIASRTFDFITWNGNRIRHVYLAYFGLLFGIIKQGISRCLILMVSMGWGVTRASLGLAMLSHGCSVCYTISH